MEYRAHTRLPVLLHAESRSAGGGRRGWVDYHGVHFFYLKIIFQKKIILTAE